MIGMLRFSKGVIGAFWLLVLVSLFSVFSEPVTRLLGWAGAVIFFVHLVEVALFTRDFGQHYPEPKFERLQVLLFGIVHLSELKIKSLPKKPETGR